MHFLKNLDKLLESLQKRTAKYSLPLNIFPNFKLLSIQDKKIFDEFLAQYPPYSDSNFVSLWSYNTEEDCAISTSNNNLVIRMRDYITNEPIYSFIGTSQVDETIKNIFSQLHNEQRPPVIKLVPEISILQIKNHDEFIIEEDRDSFDYIFSVQAHAELRGEVMHKQKNFVNRFKSLYPHIEVKKINLSDLTVQAEVLYVFDEWGKNKLDTEHEKIALQRLLKDANIIDNLFTIGLYDNVQLVGFVISELGKNDYAIGHFEKALATKYHGIYPYLNQNLAIALMEKAYKYLNFEQDLGIEGLRRSKEQMNPIFYLKKYTIKPKDGFENINVASSDNT